MRGEFIDLGGNRIYYYAAGSRGADEPIVLIHAFPHRAMSGLMLSRNCRLATEWSSTIFLGLAAAICRCGVADRIRALSDSGVRALRSGDAGIEKPILAISANAHRCSPRGVSQRDRHGGDQASRSLI